MKFYTYLENLNIHLIEYSGVIDFETGLSCMEELEEYFTLYIAKEESLKILFDVRNSNWESIETHNSLAKIARKKFSSDSVNVHQYTAIVNQQYDFPASEFENWFTDKDEAINWLLQK